MSDEHKILSFTFTIIWFILKIDKNRSQIKNSKRKPKPNTVNGIISLKVVQAKNLHNADIGIGSIR